MAEKTIADSLAEKQREISVASFFEKNRHLLGFDNKRKALMTAIKEAVDNSLDACEEARILPEISVEVIDMNNDRFRVIVEDNGPGIVEKQIPKVFAKLLYGSKFFKLSQSRGQQGIGISASVLYAQLTTGRPAKIISKIGPNHPAHYYELKIDTQKNSPEILKAEETQWAKEHGTRVELDLEGSYLKGNQSIDEYLRQTAIVNPHVTIVYTSPKAEQIIFPRVTDQLPIEPKEIKPHPYGVELGMLMNMLKNTECRTLQSFLTNEFSRVGPGTAKLICENAALLPNSKPKDVSRDMAEKLMNGIKNTKIIAPPTDCLSPITEELLEKGLKKEINAEFYCAISRPPSVYRGNPFVVEVALAYGGTMEKEEPMRVMRFANKVPLLFQQGACAITKSITTTAWRGYGLNQSQGSLPVGPVAIAVHIASAWVPFTSESKEAIAHYPEIIKEIKLALQECGRKLASYVGKKRRLKDQIDRVNVFEKYLPIVAESISVLADAKLDEVTSDFQKMIKKPEFQQQINEVEADDLKYKNSGFKEEDIEEEDAEEENIKKKKDKKDNGGSDE